MTSVGWVLVLLVLVCSTYAQQTGLDAVEKSSSKIQAFQKWLDDNGAKTDYLELTRVQGRGTTAVASDNLGRGYSLLFLPNELIITKATIEASEVANFFEDESLTDILALWLLEQLHNPSSFWKPYIDIMPKKLSLTVMWTEEELEALQASQLRSLSKRRIETIRSKYRGLFLPENQKKPLPESLGWMNKVTEEDFKWALGTVWMRAFSSDPNLAEMDVVLLPVEDMFVHMDPDAVEAHTRVRTGTNGIEFVSNTDIPKGSLIEKFVPESRTMSNSQLLFQYGFLFERYNPHNYVVVHSPFHPQMPKASIMRQMLKAAKCDLDEFLVHTGEDYEDVLCVARITTMTEQELTEPNDVSKATGRRPVSEASERRAIAAIKVLATRHLSFYATTLELDNSLIEADNSGMKSLAPNERRAIIIRRGEKQIWATLLSSMEKLESKVAQLVLNDKPKQKPASSLPRDEL